MFSSMQWSATRIILTFVLTWEKNRALLLNVAGKHVTKQRIWRNHNKNVIREIHIVNHILQAMLPWWWLPCFEVNTAFTIQKNYSFPFSTTVVENAFAFYVHFTLKFKWKLLEKRKTKNSMNETQWIKSNIEIFHFQISTPKSSFEFVRFLFGFLRIMIFCWFCLGCGCWSRKLTFHVSKCARKQKMKLSSILMNIKWMSIHNENSHKRSDGEEGWIQNSERNKWKRRIL